MDPEAERNAIRTLASERGLDPRPLRMFAGEDAQSFTCSETNRLSGKPVTCGAYP
jgi:hypothetical protein